MSINATENEDPTNGGMYCEHNRTADACEECAYAAAKEQGRPVPDSVYPYGKHEVEGSATGFTPDAA